MAEVNYKDKFHSLLEELETKEKEWAELDRRVRRTLSHLLIIAQGPSNAKITKHLGLLREALKKNAPLLEIERDVELLKDDVIKEARQPDAGEPPPPVHEIIIGILQRLPLPKDMMGRVVEIIKDIEGGLPARLVPWAVNTVSNLVLEVRTRMEEEKLQLEQLLAEVTARITQMGTSIGVAGEEALKGLSSNRALNANVTAQVEVIRTQAEKATDLKSFRSALDEALNSIQGHLEAKHNEDMEREKQLQKEIDSLKGQVESLTVELDGKRKELKTAREESHKDALTGAINRMGFESRMAEEMARMNRYGHPLSIIMVDLDKFKSINDSFGHLAGDQVLKAVSQIASAQIRDVDHFCRYGGEEFVIILPETPLAGAMAAAEKVRKAVENFRFHSRGQRVPITVSLGVGQYSKGETQPEFIDRADKALYRAKKEGRNRAMAA